MRWYFIAIFVSVLAVIPNCIAAQSKEMSEEDQKIYNRGEIADGAYISGGVIGTVFGFGIGQAIQGRFSDKGWYFTAGELASLAVFSAGTTACLLSFHIEDCANSLTVAYLGAFAYLGFRIWETIDVWATPPELNQRYRRLREEMADKKTLSFSIVPTSPRAPLGLSLVIGGF